MKYSQAAHAGTPKYLGVQALRGFAAAIVVLHHITQAWSGYPSHNHAATWINGAAGVDIFFVISGFVMFSSLGERPAEKHPARSFFVRRLLRLVPLYWFVTILYALNLLHALHEAPAVAGSPLFQNFTSIHFLESLCFIPFHSAFGVVQPILPVGWTLCFEMFFYSLLTIALALRLRAIPFLTSVMVVLAAIGCYRPESWPAVTSLASPLLLEFLAGLLLARAAAAGSNLNRRIVTPFGLLALVAMLFLPLSLASPLRVPVWGTEAALIVWTIVSWEPVLHSWWPRWTILSGEASYALYLLHLPLVVSLVKHFTYLYLDQPVSILLCVLASFAVAVPVHLYLEKPLTKLLKKLFFSRTPARQSATTTTPESHSTLSLTH